ncbi:general substrate transporter [Diaporthe eres]|nr:general substrate transporter [Diaporthe eres]
MADVEQSADLRRPTQGDRLSGRLVDSNEDDIEILERKRPAVLKNAFTEIGFCLSILASNLVSESLISGMNVLLPSLVRELHIPPESQTWPASIFILAAGAFLLPFGRLCDMYGASIVFLTSVAWLSMWTLVGGFSQNLAMLAGRHLNMSPFRRYATTNMSAIDLANDALDLGQGDSHIPQTRFSGSQASNMGMSASFVFQRSVIPRARDGWHLPTGFPRATPFSDSGSSNEVKALLLRPHSTMSTTKSTASRYNFLIVFLVTFGSLTYGYNSAIIGAVLGLNSFFKYFGIDLYGPNAAESSRITGATNGMVAAGGLLGCILMTWLGDGFGRKVAIQVRSVFCIIACIIAGIIQAASVHIAMFLVCRFLMGVGVGMVNVITPLYQSEISPAHLRGRMVGTHGFILCVGYALAGWTGFRCFYLSSPDAQWRLCLALQVVPPLCLLTGSIWLPESPRYLKAKDLDEEGLQVLRNLHRVPGEQDDILAREEFYQIRQQLQLEQREGWRQGWLKGWILLFQRKLCRKRLLFGFLTVALVQSTGCLVINNYQVLLYNGLGLYGSLPLLLYAIWDSWAAFMNYMNSLWFDKFGRIPTMVIGQVRIP